MTKGERIKQIRERQGLQQIDVAKKAKISKQLLYKYENGIITNIPSDRIAAIAEALNVSPAEIMGWAESKEEAQLSEVKTALIEIIKDISDEQAAAILALLKQQ